MSLKTLCSQLARKPLSLDVMLLFVKPASILQPICDLLDNWQYEEDQGEYQPVYEEFGSILLLLLAFAYRYNLTPADIGIRSRDSFVSKLLSQGHLGRPLDSLTEQEQEHLDGWIRGLFDTDTGGLGDELMSSCPPQDFYLLIPTLFQNIALAFGSGCLAEETLKGGLECKFQAFYITHCRRRCGGDGTTANLSRPCRYVSASLSDSGYPVPLRLPFQRSKGRAKGNPQNFPITPNSQRHLDRSFNDANICFESGGKAARTRSAIVPAP